MIFNVEPLGPVTVPSSTSWTATRPSPVNGNSFTLSSLTSKPEDDQSILTVIGIGCSPEPDPAGSSAGSTAHPNIRLETMISCFNMMTIVEQRTSHHEGLLIWCGCGYTGHSGGRLLVGKAGEVTVAHDDAV